MNRDPSAARRSPSLRPMTASSVKKTQLEKKLLRRAAGAVERSSEEDPSNAIRTNCEQEEEKKIRRRGLGEDDFGAQQWLQPLPGRMAEISEQRSASFAPTVE